MKKTNYLFIFFILIGLIACQNTDFSKPSEVIKDYIELSEKNKHDVLYDKFLSAKSKELVTKDEYIKTKNLPDTFLNSRSGYTMSVTDLPSDMNYPSYRRFKVEQQYLYQNEPIYSLSYYTLINEDGKWKVIWTGTLSSFADEKLKSGNYAEARKAYRKIIEINPFHGHTYDILSWCYSRDNSLNGNERDEGMATNAKYAIELEKEVPSHYNTLAGYYAQIWNEDLAIQTFERGLSYCKDKWDKKVFYQNLSDSYLSKNDFVQAESYVKKALTIDTTSTFSWLKYGEIMFKSNKIDEAITYYEKALQQDKMETFLQGWLYYRYACACMLAHRCETAKEYILKALDIQPNDWDYRNLYNQIKYCK